MNKKAPDDGLTPFQPNSIPKMAMVYWKTDVKVRLGDRVRYQRLLWTATEGIVVYVPGESEINEDLEYGGVAKWVLRLRNGRYIVMCCMPGGQAHRRVTFVERGLPKWLITPQDRMK